MEERGMSESQHETSPGGPDEEGSRDSRSEGGEEFRDSRLQDEEQLHASFEDVEEPSPETDPFRGGTSEGDDGEDAVDDGATDGEGEPT
jgi:hypothetical protein